MKPLLVFVGVSLLFFLLRAWWNAPVSATASILCLIRGYHPPVRHPLGGFTCGECGHAGADLGAMGFTGGGYIRSLRRLFSREHGGITTCTTSFMPGPKGW